MKKAIVLFVLVAFCVALVSCGPKTPYEEGYALGAKFKIDMAGASELEKMQKENDTQAESTEKYKNDMDKMKKFLTGWNDAVEGKKEETGP